MFSLHGNMVTKHGNMVTKHVYRIMSAPAARGDNATAIATQPGFTNPLPAALGRPATPAATAENPQAALLYDFMRKVLKLVSFRAALLCHNFDFSPLQAEEVMHKVSARFCRRCCCSCSF